MQLKSDEDHTGSLLPDFELEKAQKSLSTSIGLRIHFFVSVILVVLSLIIWTLAEFKIALFPFWIIVAGFFCSTLAIHFYLFVCEERQWLKLHFSLFFSLNICLFFVWLFNTDYEPAKSCPKENSTCTPTSEKQSNIWFIYPLFIWTNFLVVHYCWKVFEKDTHRLIWTHSCLFWSLNLMNLFINIAAHATFPWFPIAFFALSIPLILHWTYHWDPGHWFLLHSRLFVSGNLMFFIIWASNTKNFPWFLVLLIVWSLALSLHWKFHTAPEKESENSVPYSSNEFDNQEPIGNSRDELWKQSENNNNQDPSFSIVELDKENDEE